MTYQVIDSQHDSTPLLAAPAQVWVIAALEICIQHADDHYLLLGYPSYPLAGGLPHDEGYWTIPFEALPVPMHYSAPTTVGSLRNLTNSIDSAALADAASQLAYQMGLQDAGIEYRGEFFEIKNSPRTPGLVKAYKVVRFGLTSVAAASVRNLADPDVRYGYVYLPMSQYDTITKERHSSEHHRTERWYLGKPLMSDIEHLLTDESRRYAIASSAISVDDNLFSRDESGLIISADLGGYGSALKYARTHMRSFSEGSEAIQASFRSSVSAAFERMFTRVGMTQVQTAGDGFLAALPDRVISDVKLAVDEILEEWSSVLDDVQELNSAIDDPDYRVGSRLAIHWGDYKFGRIGGPSSFAPAFDGGAIIEVARLEQGLSSFMASPDTPPEIRLTKRSNCVAASEDLRSRLGSRWRPSLTNARSVGRRDLASKEYGGVGFVWELRTR